MSLDQVDPVHQYVISVLVPETSFWGETGGVVAKCWLFSEANALPQGFNTNQKYRKIQHDGVSQRFAGYRKKQKKKQQHIQPAIQQAPQLYMVMEDGCLDDKCPNVKTQSLTKA